MKEQQIQDLILGFCIYLFIYVHFLFGGSQSFKEQVFSNPFAQILKGTISFGNWSFF